MRTVRRPLGCRGPPASAGSAPPPVRSRGSAPQMRTQAYAPHCNHCGRHAAAGEITSTGYRHQCDADCPRTERPSDVNDARIPHATLHEPQQGHRHGHTDPGDEERFAWGDHRPSPAVIGARGVWKYTPPNRRYPGDSSF